MARQKKFSDYTKANRERIVREGARYGLTRRQSRERVNRGTFTPLARTPEKRIPEHAPYYPVTVGAELKARAMRNLDRILGFDDPFSEANRTAVLDAVENHASDAALRRMADASEDELKQWAKYQRARSYKKTQTPEWVRNLGWTDDNGKWRNVFWYH